MVIYQPPKAIKKNVPICKIYILNGDKISSKTVLFTCRFSAWLPNIIKLVHFDSGQLTLFFGTWYIHVHVCVFEAMLFGMWRGVGVYWKGAIHLRFLLCPMLAQQVRRKAINPIQSHDFNVTCTVYMMRCVFSGARNRWDVGKKKKTAVDDRSLVVISCTI